jgi:hypothetical protein
MPEFECLERKGSQKYSVVDVNVVSGSNSYNSVNMSDNTYYVQERQAKPLPFRA